MSVREPDAAGFLHGLINRDIHVVADPTLLLSTSDYRNIVGEPIVTEPYIYYYTPSHVLDYNAEAMAVALANKLGLKIVTSYPRYGKRNGMQGVLTGPFEFVNLIENAQFVIGKSYHLVVFSILFHKSFITINAKADIRVKSLLDQLSITGRNINSIDDYYNLIEIDYDVAESKLKRIKQNSFEYLRGALDECNFHEAL